MKLVQWIKSLYAPQDVPDTIAVRPAIRTQELRDLLQQTMNTTDLVNADRLLLLRLATYVEKLEQKSVKPSKEKSHGRKTVTKKPLRTT